MVITGIFALLAARTELEIAAESTGFTMRTEIFPWSRSAISLDCLAGSFWASTIFTFTPALSAAAFTLLAIVTKKGLFWVETEKPMVTFLEPEAAPSAFFSEEPQPAAEMRAAPIRAANAIFFNNLFSSLIFLAVHKHCE